MGKTAFDFVPLPDMLCTFQLQITRHCFVNHYVKTKTSAKRTQKQNHFEDLFPTASALTITNFTSNYASIDSSHPEIKTKVAKIILKNFSKAMRP